MKLTKFQIDIQPFTWDFIPLKDYCKCTQHTDNYLWLKFLFISIEIEWKD